MAKAYINSLANYIPEKVMTNFDFEKMFETNNEWIVSRTGIETRHFARDDEGDYEMAIKAIENLQKKGTDLSKVDAIIVPTTTKDYSFPSTAGLIQKHLGLKNCFTFDLSAACSGYIYSLNTAASLIESGDAKNVLIVAAEKLTKDTDFDDRSTAILFGDAASTALISATDDDSKGIISMDMKSQVRDDILLLKAGGSAYPISGEAIDKKEDKLFMEGTEVFKIAVTEFVNSIDRVIEKAKLSIKDISFFVPHQANMRIVQAVAKRIGVSFDKIGIILNKYGNTSSSSIGIGLTEAYEAGKIKKGDVVLLTAFGAGLTWGSSLIRW